MERYTMPEITRRIRLLVPDFPLRDERNQRVWAEVISEVTGLGTDDLLTAYREYLHGRDADDAFFACAPDEPVVECQCRRCGRCDYDVGGETDPVALVRICRDIAAEHGDVEWVRFSVYGHGRVLQGDARGWRRLCAHGRVVCSWCGVPQPPPEWDTDYDPDLWPYVGVVPGTEWHPV